MHHIKSKAAPPQVDILSYRHPDKWALAIDWPKEGIKNGSAIPLSIKVLDGSIPGVEVPLSEAFDGPISSRIEITNPGDFQFIGKGRTSISSCDVILSEAGIADLLPINRLGDNDQIDLTVTISATSTKLQRATQSGQCAILPGILIGY